MTAYGRNERGPPDVAISNGHRGCLLYTSDAADERSSVDLGGRRIIKKKKRKYKSGVALDKIDRQRTTQMSKTSTKARHV